MGAVVVAAGIWLLMMFEETRPHLRIGLGSMALSYVLAWYVPVHFKHRRVKSQNRLLDRCRALLILGSQAFEAGNRAGADEILMRIRKLEAHWRLGNGIGFRVSLALWAIFWGVTACVLVRLLGALVVHYGWTGEMLPWEKIPSEISLVVIISFMAPLYALMGYFEAWANPWAIDNCGDRLWQLIHGPRGVAAVPEQDELSVPDFDGMNPYEIFGFGPTFTRRALDRARRRLARDLHPDRWHNASPQERRIREEALKRVNAAYDMLRQQAA